jgi:hypothetical protein
MKRLNIHFLLSIAAGAYSIGLFYYNKEHKKEVDPEDHIKTERRLEKLEEAYKDLQAEKTSQMRSDPIKNDSL